ncbi:MAG TPA: DUF4330 family protein, partial [Oscillospiraceae bacterium]|nr:DUF4330 family protein [Oscillospiraceae bacterium]
SIFYLDFDKTNLESIKHPGERQEIFVTFLIENIRDVSVNAVNEGDLFKNSETGGMLGKVINKTVSHAQIATTDKNGNIIYVDVPDRYNMKIVFECSGTISEENIKISNEPIQIGESITLESKIIKTNGTVFGIEY